MGRTVVKPRLVAGTYGKAEPQQPGLPGIDTWQNREKRQSRGMTDAEREIEAIVSDVEACHLDLTDWEFDFIKSIRRQWDTKRSLSPAQDAKLRKIHQEKT